MRQVHGTLRHAHFHDIAYQRYKDTKRRKVADVVLLRAAQKFLKGGKAKYPSDKANARLVMAVMAFKVKYKCYEVHMGRFTYLVESSSALLV